MLAGSKTHVFGLGLARLAWLGLGLGVWRVKAGELPMTIALVISNHPDLEEVTSSFNIPFTELS